MPIYAATRDQSYRKSFPMRAADSLSSFALSDLGWLAIFNLLLFQTTIQNTTGFSFIDEAATGIAILISLFSSAWRLYQGRAGKWVHHCSFCLALLVFWGVTSNLISGVAIGCSPIIIDLYACVKFPIALVCMVAVLHERQRLYRAVEAECRFFVVVLLAFGIANLFIQIGDFGSDPRYGLRASYRFVFGHPEMLVFVCVGIVLVFARDYRRNIRWIFVALMVMCLSLRSKGIAFAAVTLLLVVSWGHRGKLSFIHVLFGALAAIAIGWDQYQYYFMSSGFARTELTKAAVQIANSYFPFGSGFGTYGSNITADSRYYSPLYFKYGLSAVYGLIPGDVSFLSDVFWPIVIGQFGWAGLILYCVMLVALILGVYRFASDRGQRLCVVLCFAFLLISSTAESAFFHPNAIYLAFCLALALVRKVPE